MAEVKVLIKGYLAKDTGGHTCATISLVRDQGLNIIVDPGTVKNEKVIINKLKQNNLTPAEINIVFLTHSHLDHYRQLGLFKKAKILDYWGWWLGDKNFAASARISKNINIIKTPGHSNDGLSMLVKTNKGKVAVCGDVFWRKNFPKNDAYATDRKKLDASRKKILKVADYIIPGHDEMYKNNKP